MTTLDRLGPDDLRAVVAAFRDALRAHEDGINRLNVYPVPDGDTGTNMALTMESVVAELDGLPADADRAAVCKGVGHGSLMGARGNSGVILSQILRGLTQVFAAAETVDGSTFARGLTAASEGAYQAVGNPVEGTILTVVREAAEGATAAATTSSELVVVVDAALASGVDALARTPDLLPVLAEAGVVDSGGTGLLLMLHAALAVIDGREVPAASVTEAVADAGSVDQLKAKADLAHQDHGTAKGIADLRYEVMYLLEAPDESIPGFKDVWAGIGDSIVVVGGEGLYNCHIHTDDIGSSIEAAIQIGQPSKIRVTDLLEELEEERWVREAEVGPEPDLEPVTTAVVAIATGDGIKRIFHSLGVQRVITGGQSMNPSTAQILEAVEAVNANDVIILPNNKNIIAVAEQVDANTTKTVRVVPTRGIPEGFAALISYDPGADGASNAREMAEAAENVAAGELTIAVRASSCEVGPIAEGDHLGIARRGIRAVAPTCAQAAIGLLSELISDEHEILTIIEGEGANAGDTRQITEWLQDQRAHVTAEIHHGGQPLYPYYFGVE